MKKLRERKFSKKRNQRAVYLVICEGETEKEYIETLKIHYRLPIVIKTKVAGNKINSRLVNQYLSDFSIDKDDNYKIFFVYDADIEPIVDKLKNLKGSLILSNPCIELWFILHTNCYTKRSETKSIVSDLTNVHPVWNSYKKGTLTYTQAKYLVENIREAIKNANLLKCHENPSTNMSVLINALESEKKR